jgi:hypothetical protein
VLPEELGNGDNWRKLQNNDGGFVRRASPKSARLEAG